MAGHEYFIVPYSRNVDFVGRSAELEELARLHLTQRYSRISVTGLGGIGKSELVCEYVYRLKEKSNDISVFWITASSLEHWARAYATIAKAVDVPAAAPDETIQQVVNGWLSKREAGPWLIVLDTGQNPDFLFKTIPESDPPICPINELPHSIQGTTIIISRNRKSGLRFAPGNSIVEVSRMGADSSTSIVRSHLGTSLCRKSSVRELQDLIDVLQCHPLAMAEVSRFINANSMTVAHYLEVFQNGDDAQINLLSKNLGYSLDMDEEGLAISKGVLAIEQFQDQHEQAAKVLHLMCYLGAVGIPKAVLSSPEPLYMTLGTLKAYSLITEDAANETYTVHRLVFLAFLKTSIRDESLIEEALEAVIAKSSGFGDDEARRLACAQHALRQFAALPQPASARSSAAAADLYVEESLRLQRDGRWESAEESAQEALRLRSTISTDGADTLTGVTNLAIILIQQCKTEQARTLYEEWQEQFPQQQVLLKKRISALLLKAEGKYGEAVKDCREVMEGLQIKHQSDPLHPELLASIHDYASALESNGMNGEADSLAHFQRAYNGRRSRQGPYHPSTLASLNGLGIIFKRRGQYDKALRMIQEASDGRSNILRPDHPDIFMSLGNKAMVLYEMGNYSEAEAFQKIALDSLTKIWGTKHPIALKSKSDAALIELEQGRYASAEQMNRDIWEARKAALGDMHPDTLTSAHQLAIATRRCGGCSQAEELSKSVLDWRTTALHDTHPDRLASLDHRAIVLSGQDHHPEAKAAIDSACRKRIDTLGAEHPDSIITYNHESEIQQRYLHAHPSDQTLDALRTLRDRLSSGRALLTRLLGPLHPTTLKATTKLALCQTDIAESEPPSGRAPRYHDQPSWDRQQQTARLLTVEPTYRAAMDGFRTALGTEHPTTLDAVSRCAQALRVMGKEAEALELFREACSGYGRVFGAEAVLTRRCFGEMVAR